MQSFEKQRSSDLEGNFPSVESLRSSATQEEIFRVDHAVQIGVLKVGELPFYYSTMTYEVTDFGNGFFWKLNQPVGILRNVKRVSEHSFDITILKCGIDCYAFKDFLKTLPASMLELEILYPDPSFMVDNSRSSSFWDRWELNGSGSAHEELVQSRLDPVVSALNRWQRLISHSPKILFYGCGRGEEVIFFVRQLRAKLQGAELYALDQSSIQLQCLEHKLKQGKIRRLFKDLDIKVNLVCSSFEESRKNLELGGMDLIMMHGINDSQGLVYQDSLEATSCASRHLKSGGLALSAAYGIHLLNSQDFNRLGYKVLESISAVHLYCPILPVVYVAQKTAAASCT